MAFVKKVGNSYCVFQGNSGRRLSCHGSGSNGKKSAEDRVKVLHKKHMPKASNRGKRAQKSLEKKK